MRDLFSMEEEEFIKVSAKTGEGVAELLKELITRIPAPLNCQRESSFKALIFDTWFTSWRGTICLVLVKNGSIKVNTLILLFVMYLWLDEVFFATDGEDW